MRILFVLIIFQIFNKFIYTIFTGIGTECTTTSGTCTGEGTCLSTDGLLDPTGSQTGSKWYY